MIYDTKLRHNLEVGRLMYRLAKEKGKSEPECRSCFLVGYLHDIGYEFCENCPSEHPYIGAEMLRFVGFDYFEVIALHGNTTKYQDDEMLWLLNAADLQVDSKGNFVGYNGRLEDVKERYGKNSKEYISARSIAKICKKKGLFLKDEQGYISN